MWRDSNVSTCLFAVVAVVTSAGAQPCVPRLSDEFATGLLAGRVRVLLSDPAAGVLYAGGSLLSLGQGRPRAMASWDGRRWTGLGDDLWLATYGPDPTVRALAMFDDGSGPALYAGGDFRLAGGFYVERIARWDGSTWNPVGAGFDGTVLALRAFDDGSGPALYAAGAFAHAGGQPAAGIARWANGTWQSLGSGVAGGFNPSGTALEVFDDGSGPALYLGGSFTSVSGVLATNIACWRNPGWRAVGAGLSGRPTALATVDLGQGPALFAGGEFGSAGGQPNTRYIARWDGAAWSALGTGLDSPVNGITGFGEPPERSLYVTATYGVAYRWDGGQWSEFASGLSEARVARCFAVHPGSSGPMLVMGGDYGGGDYGYGFIAHRRPSRWLTGMLDSGVSDGRYAAVSVLDDGAGPALFVSGDFAGVDGVESAGLARYDGARWRAMGLPAGSEVWQVVAADEPTGPALFAAGRFPGTPGTTLARYAGGAWQMLGEPVESNLVVFPPGPAGALYTTSAVPPAITVRGPGGWAVFASLAGAGTQTGISALRVLDDGSGPALFVFGSFTSIAGLPITNMAAWNGLSWRGFGGGPAPPAGGGAAVYTAVVFDDGGGPAVYVGGNFPGAGGLASPYIARWREGMWSAVPSPGGPVQALAVFDDGSGRALYAAGSFRPSPSTASAVLARLSGASWTYLGGAADGLSRSLAVFDDGSGAALWLGGSFGHIGSTETVQIARWITCHGAVCYPNCDLSTGPTGGATLSALDFMCFQWAFAAGLAYGNCDGSATPLGDRTLNVADFVCFMERFVAGCR